MRYDAAIIGAGADGLAAATILARSGFKTIVLERAEKPGGRCMTQEFHPGFRASPLSDEIAPIPAHIYWSLDLARHGAVFVPAPCSTALWLDRADSLCPDDRILAGIATLRDDTIARAEADSTPARKPVPFIGRTENSTPWPTDNLATASLQDTLARQGAEGDRAAHLMALALAGRAAHPALAGSALHLLAPGSGGAGLVAGGLHKLTDALTAVALGAGAEISCGLEVVDIVHANGKVTGVRLADGTAIEARSVLSTLDLKRTFLSLFTWNDLPAGASKRIAAFRTSGSTARLLVALDGMPEIPSWGTLQMLRGPIHLAPSADDFAAAYTAWRSETANGHLPITLRFPSALDPSLCAPGMAVMTATVGCIPSRLFDGSWTHEKRDALREKVLAAAERALPGLSKQVLGSQLIVPPDIEDALGLTDGDLWGGEIAPDQMFSMRPWLRQASPRTPIAGVYLAGPSSAAGPLGSCVAGVIAAKAIAVDRGHGR